jgi:hypothetical protein
MAKPEEAGSPVAVVPIHSPNLPVDMYLVGVRRELGIAEPADAAFRRLAQANEEAPSATGEVRRLIVALKGMTTSDDSGERVQLLRHLYSTAKSKNFDKTMTKLIADLEPEIAIPEPAAILQARRNAKARASLLLKYGGLTSKEVAELSGSTAENRAALAASWKQQSRIFSVTYRGKQIFPGFQFNNEGQPYPVIGEVIKVLGLEHEWQLALWFIANNGYLGGRQPVELLETEPAKVIEAAKRERDDFSF